MRATSPMFLTILGGLGLLAAHGACFAAAVPWAESFESFTNGHPIGLEADWEAGDSVVVTTNPVVVGALTNAALFPLGGPHEKALALGGALTNTVSSATGGVVVLDLLAMPARRTVVDADPTMQLAAYVATNGRLVIWHRNLTNEAAPFNEWRALTNSPVLPSNEWTRLSIRMDQDTAMYQVSVNGTDPLADDTGWTSNNGARPGPWFHMAQTNRAMAQFGTLGAVTSYLDDVVVARRRLSFSTNGFVEGVEAGFIDSNTPMTIALSWDTFAATNGEDLALDPGKLWVTNLPAGLAVSARVSAPTQLTVTVTGQATPNEAGNSVSNLEFVFGDAAFALGREWDVEGATVTNLLIQFESSSAAELTYDTTQFAERAANDGGVAGSATLTLAGRAFAGTNGGDFVVSGWVSTPDIPAGLTASVVRADAQQVVLSFAGQAGAHAAGDSVTNLTITFLDGAFASGTAATVSNASRSDLEIQFSDPPEVRCTSLVFEESVTNDGTIGNTVGMTIEGGQFAAGVFAEGAEYEADNVPPGLILSLAPAGVTQLVVSLGGAAAPHTAAAGRTLSVRLLDAAFQGPVPAAYILGVSNAFTVTFRDPPVLACGSAVFRERGDDNGTIGNAIAVGLAGAEFAAGPFVSNVHFTATGVPAGLELTLSRSSATVATASLTGQAVAHSNANDTVIGLAFLDAAFLHVAVSNILGAVTNLALDFIDLGPANAVPFTDDFEPYPNGFALVGTNGWTGEEEEGVVSNDPQRVAELQAYGGRYPLATAHTQLVHVNGALHNRTRSVAGRPVFLDCMAYIQGRATPLEAGADDQLGVYVNTNQQVVVWHCDRTGLPTNEWRVLAETLVATGAWHRVTICQDYRHAMFKVKVDEVELRDAAGWSGPGGTQPGPWFHMTQTNGYMSELVFGGGKTQRPVPVDDVSVTYEDPLPRGATFFFR